MSDTRSTRSMCSLCPSVKIENFENHHLANSLPFNTMGSQCASRIPFILSDKICVSSQQCAFSSISGFSWNAPNSSAWTLQTEQKGKKCRIITRSFSFIQTLRQQRISWKQPPLYTFSVFLQARAIRIFARAFLAHLIQFPTKNKVGFPLCGCQNF